MQIYMNYVCVCVCDRRRITVFIKQFQNLRNRDKILIVIINMLLIFRIDV